MLPGMYPLENSWEKNGQETRYLSTFHHLFFFKKVLRSQDSTVASKGVQLIIKIWKFLALGDSLGHIQVLHKVLAPYKAFKAPI